MNGSITTLGPDWAKVLTPLSKGAHPYLILINRRVAGTALPLEAHSLGPTQGPLLQLLDCIFFWFQLLDNTQMCGGSWFRMKGIFLIDGAPDLSYILN